MPEKGTRGPIPTGRPGSWILDLFVAAPPCPRLLAGWTSKCSSVACEREKNSFSCKSNFFFLLFFLLQVQFVTQFPPFQEELWEGKGSWSCWSWSWSCYVSPFTVTLLSASVEKTHAGRSAGFSDSLGYTRCCVHSFLPACLLLLLLLSHKVVQPPWKHALDTRGSLTPVICIFIFFTMCTKYFAQ